ncbi:MAG: hypothetical protein ABL860_09010 [Candidatus Nitrotoga sp.]
MNYLNIIERYREHRLGLQDLLATILGGISSPELLGDSGRLRQALNALSPHYPFATLIYTLDQQGIQTSENVNHSGKMHHTHSSLGKNRSQRPYFILAHHSDQVVVTEPYLSTENNKLCVSAAVKLNNPTTAQHGYLVLDLDLAKTISFFMGDSSRSRFEPFFKFIYLLIVIGLLSVVLLLLFAAFTDIATLFQTGHTLETIQLKPFSIIIFITLALAIFDLGKTILEEEVLMRKDILRHSSTRRTITRFIAAILIAVSIEALMLMFKGALNNGAESLQGVWMMLTAVGLLVGLGIYVYCGVKAEAILLGLRK